MAVKIENKNKDWPAYVFTGLSDGLIVPFAIMAGTSRISSSSSEVTNFLVYVIPGAAFLMALGGYFTAKDRSTDSITPIEKKAETIKKFYQRIGLSPELQQRATVEQLEDNKQFNDLSVPNIPTPPLAAALLIFISYCLGGYISLMPFFYFEDPIDALKISAALTLPLLLIFGFYKYQFLGLKGVYGGMIQFVVGGLAAAAAYAVAKLVVA